MMVVQKENSLSIHTKPLHSPTQVDTWGCSKNLCYLPHNKHHMQEYKVSHLKCHLTICTIFGEKATVFAINDIIGRLAHKAQLLRHRNQIS